MVRLELEPLASPERLAAHLRLIADAIDHGYNNGFAPKWHVVDAKTGDRVVCKTNIKRLLERR
jgi:hypothetical protein